MIVRRTGPATAVDFSAAGCFCLSGGRVLLIERQAGKRFAGHWGIPTGKLEPHESAREAARRELAEEVGIVASPAQLTLVAQYLVDDGASRFGYDAFALELDAAPQLRLRAAEIRRAAWIEPLALLPQPTVPFLDETLDDFRAFCAGRSRC